jgi:hypothetical protein
MVKRLILLAFCGAALLPAGAGAQQMDYLARQRIETAVARLSDPLAAGTLAADAAAIMAELGLSPFRVAAPDVPARDFVTDTSAVIELVDIRLLLTQIAIQTGARDHIALVRAQGDRDHDVILLRGGLVTLHGLVALSVGTPAEDFVVETAEGVTFARPLAIWSDAGLALESGDRLILDRPSGAFLANLGRLDIAGGTILGSNAPNPAEPAFRPFVMTAGQGSFAATLATFQALGFGGSDVFGGIAIANNGIVAASFASALTESTLIDVSTLGLLGTTGAVIADNQIAGSTGTAILMSDAQDTIILGNSFAALTGAQAIRVTAASGNAHIAGNQITGSARTGILIDRDSHGVEISDNLVLGSLTTGIGVNSASCVMVIANLVASNGGTGISLTDTDAAIADGNAILFNHGSGVLLRDQGATALVRLGGNVLIGNRDGLRGATPGNVALNGNDLDGQLPRIFAGDLAPMTVDWLRNRRHAAPAALHIPSPAPCAIQGNG